MYKPGDVVIVRFPDDEEFIGRVEKSSLIEKILWYSVLIATMIGDIRVVVSSEIVLPYSGDHDERTIPDGKDYS